MDQSDVIRQLWENVKKKINLTDSSESSQALKLVWPMAASTGIYVGLVNFIRLTTNLTDGCHSFLLVMGQLRFIRTPSYVTPPSSPPSLDIPGRYLRGRLDHHMPGHAVSLPSYFQVCAFVPRTKGEINYSCWDLAGGEAGGACCGGRE